MLACDDRGCELGVDNAVIGLLDGIEGLLPEAWLSEEYTTVDPRLETGYEVEDSITADPVSTTDEVCIGATNEDAR